MATIITQKELNQIIWNACGTFRGVIDPSEYKDYILTMLFIKYVSDVYRDKHDEHLKKYDGDAERAEYAMKHERFIVPKNSTFDSLFEHRNDSNIGELINTALIDFEEANREKLSSEDGSSIFRNIDFNSNKLGETKDRNTRLKNLLIDFGDEKLNL
jgi:type I restriction enzyme M protein